jgi:hypothetical protein
VRRLDRRLLRLERLIVPVGCGHCKGWTPIAICDDRDYCLREETCPECGRTVPIEERLIFVGVSLEAI